MLVTWNNTWNHMKINDFNIVHISLAAASVVAGDATARTTTSTPNIIATEHSHLMMCVLDGSCMSACSKSTFKCKVACGQYRTCIRHIIRTYVSCTCEVWLTCKMLEFWFMYRMHEVQLTCRIHTKSNLHADAWSLICVWGSTLTQVKHEK